MRSFSLKLLAWTGSLALLTPTIEARAQAPAVIPAAASATPPTETVRIELNLVGVTAKDAELGKLIQEWLDGSGVSYVALPVASLNLDDIRQPRGAGPAVRIWIVQTTPELVSLYLAEPDAQRYLVRLVPLASGWNELGREHVVQVVLSSALAFMDKKAASSLAEVEKALAGAPNDSASLPEKLRAVPAPPEKPRARTTERLTEPPPSASEGVRVRWAPSVGVGYGFSVADRFSHGPSVLVGSTWKGARWGVGGILVGAYRLPETVTTRDAIVTEQSVPVTLRAVLVRGSGTTLSWLAELGGGVECVSVEPGRKPGSDVVPRPAGWDFRPFVSLAIGASWHTGTLTLALVPELSVYTSTTYYVVETPSGPRTEHMLTNLRPGLTLRLSWPGD